MATARQIKVNPSNPQQRYILYSNGVIQALGGALPISQVEASVNDDNSPNAPTFVTWANPDIAVAINVTDWTTPAGYTLTAYGHVWAWGGNPHVPGATGGSHFLTDTQEFYFGLNGGFQSPTYGFVIDFSMDPAANGEGVFLKYNGDALAFGTGVTAISHSEFLSDAQSAALIYDWSDNGYFILDTIGRIWGGNGKSSLGIGSAATFGGDTAASVVVWGRDGAGFAMYDPSTGQGWMLDTFGRVYPINHSGDAPGFPTALQRIWVDIGIINDGTGADPLRLTILNNTGGQFEWVASTAPTVAVVTPADASTVIDTTRPLLGWTFIDAEGDAQKQFVTKVFTDAVHAGGGFDPETSTAVFTFQGSGNLARSVQMTVDLTNADYWFYVKASDTSNLQSNWAFAGFTMDVVPPATPTVSATSLDGVGGIQVDITVDPTDLTGDELFAVQFRDSDDLADQWYFLSGGDQLSYDTGTGVGQIIDYQARFGIERSYRAKNYIYNTVTGAFLGSDWSNTATATLAGTAGAATIDWLLSAATTPDEQIVVKVNPGFTPTQHSIAGVFYPLGRREPIVVSDGKPKAATFDLEMWVLTNAERLAMLAILDLDVTLLLRDPFGRSWYFRPVGDIKYELLRSVALATETTPIRDAHKVTIACQEVRRPTGAAVITTIIV